MLAEMSAPDQSTFVCVARVNCISDRKINWQRRNTKIARREKDGMMNKIRFCVGAINSKRCVCQAFREKSVVKEGSFVTG